MMKEFFNFAVRPEIDTIRLFFKVDLQKCAYRAFFDNEFTKEICTLEPMRDDRGEYVIIDGKKEIKPTWEKLRLDFRFSSYSKMQVFEDRITWGSKQQYSIPVICIEYSVPKYYKFTNGINRGVSAEIGGVDDFLNPCFEALEALNLFHYWNDTKENILLFMRSNFQIRRLDLSYNFRVDDVKLALIHLSSCRLPKQTAKTKSNEQTDDEMSQPKREGDYSSVTFGGGKGSSYKVIFYDKELEQKNLFSTIERDLSYECRQEKKKWYKENKHFFEKIVRFEVQFHFRFFVYHIPDVKIKKGENMATKIINLCSGYWLGLLRKFDEQLNTINHHSAEEYDITSNALDRLEELEMLGELSRTQYSTLQNFIMKCHKYGFVKVQKSMSKSLFSQYYNKVKKLTGFDIKVVCLEELPIMRIMQETIGQNWLDRGLESLYFDAPDYEQRTAV